MISRNMIPTVEIPSANKSVSVSASVTTSIAAQKFKPSAQALLKTEPVEIWDTRPNEPAYARLDDSTTQARNVYDQPIDLVALVQEESAQQASRNQSLFINGNPAIGDNPNRNKQHGFYFTADNCIGCHACESACAEKNETPSHLAFRSVGYVEGGSFPDFQRMNISMACNHCDDPVCLKGCPTLAYTKHTEYGAVLQDPDTCFGCGYCTWVCPYNAPQLDPVKGEVSKCNMCVDRLEVGLKPACVSACVGNALDFGVIENVPENRDQAKVSIPGFPDPEISRPNIRFQQKTGLPEEMTRTDDAPIKYHLDKSTGNYKPTLDPKHGHEKYWNIARLSSRENPLALFTLCTQAGIGAFVITFLGSLLGIDVFRALFNSDWFLFAPLFGFGLAAFGLFLSTTHLGKPFRFYRGFNNLRYSPVSREGLGVAIFMVFAALTLLFSTPNNETVSQLMKSIFSLDLSLLRGPLLSAAVSVSGVVSVIGAIGGLYYMIKCYLIPARPFWNHWQTAASFVGTTLSLGSLLMGTIAVVGVLTSSLGSSLQSVFSGFSVCLIAGIGLELIGLYAHAKENISAEHEGAASHYIQTTTFGKTYWLRNVVLVSALAIVLVLSLVDLSGEIGLLLWFVVGAITLMMSLVSRALFYVLVVPTTMPGAFFWRNKGFEQHARDIGLASVVDAGIVADVH